MCQGWRRLLGLGLGLEGVCQGWRRLLKSSRSWCQRVGEAGELLLDLCESQVALAAALLPPELCSLCVFTGTGPGAKVGRLGQQPPLLLLWHPETPAELAGCQLHPRS